MKITELYRTDGGPPRTHYANTIEELLAADWIEEWKKQTYEDGIPRFYQYSLDDNELIAEIDGGMSRLVVGIIEDCDDLSALNIPKLQPITYDYVASREAELRDKYKLNVSNLLKMLKEHKER